MVAYSFKARFAQPIIDGTKLQTIRAPRKRHARPGEELQLYTGMRTKQCKLIRKARCIEVLPMQIDFTANVIDLKSNLRVLIGRVNAPPVEEAFDGMSIVHLDAFARLDGFENWMDMTAFWRVEHPDVADFEGVLIRWAP